MEDTKSKVYIKTDERGCILRCEGGYTMANIDDPVQWLLIDEGAGDRYNLCQSHYFDRLYTEDGIPRYKWDGEKAVLRSDTEIAADKAAMDAAQEQPTQLDNIEQTQIIMMEAMADQYEESQERDLTSMEVQATIYEEILALKGEV